MKQTKLFLILAMALMLLPVVMSESTFPFEWAQQQKVVMPLSALSLTVVNGGLCQASGISGTIDPEGKLFSCSSVYTGCVVQVYDSKWNLLAEVNIDGGSSEKVSGTFYQFYTCTKTETVCPEFTDAGCGQNGCGSTQMLRTRQCTNGDGSKYTENYCVLTSPCRDISCIDGETKLWACSGTTASYQLCTGGNWASKTISNAPGCTSTGTTTCPKEGCSPVDGSAIRQHFEITDFKILSDISDLKHGDIVKAKVTVQNKGNARDDNILEFQLKNSRIKPLAIVEQLPGFCPQNKFADTKRVELDAGETVTIEMQATIPTQDDYDVCDADFPSVYGERYLPVATLTRGADVIDNQKSLDLLSVPFPDSPSNTTDGSIVIIASILGGVVGIMIGYIWGPFGSMILGIIGAALGFIMGALL